MEENVSSTRAVMVVIPLTTMNASESNPGFPLGTGIQEALMNTEMNLLIHTGY